MEARSYGREVGVATVFGASCPGIHSGEMHRRASSLVAAVLTLAATVLISTGTPVFAGSGDPAVTLRSASPVTVTGTGFAARERVRVVVVLGHVRNVLRRRTNAHGAFRAVFAGMTADRCSSLAVHAKGATGDTASWHRRPPVMCAPERTP